jgi:hypothetical protein
MRTDTFLSDDELADMTGYAIKSRQIEWLRGNGLPFFVSASGHPRVARTLLTGDSKAKKRPQLNLDGLARVKASK